MESEKIKILESQIAEVEKAEAQNVKDTETTTKRLEQAQARVESIKVDHQEARTERQKILAMNGDPGKINVQVKKLKDEEELLEDTITGLKNRLDELEEERDRLPVRKNDLEQEIVELTLAAWLPGLMKKAEDFAEALTNWMQKNYELDMPLHPLSTRQRFFVVSSWGGALETIPRIYYAKDLKPGEDIRGRDLFNERMCRETWQRKRESKEKELKAVVA